MSKAKNTHTALIIFAKRPHIGQGKQRLAADIGMEKAYVIAQLLLERTIETANKWLGPLILSPASVEDSLWASELCKREVIVIPQLDSDLGQRLQQVDREARMLGIEQCIFIGTDAPLLSIDDLNAVKIALKDDDQVYLPATDGGVVVMASRKPWQNLQTVTWSTKKVCSELKSLGKQQGLSVRLMQKLSDMDDLASLNEIKYELGAHTKSSKTLFHLNNLLKEITK